VLSIVCLVLPAWADFETAMDAYNRKDYATALREWQALTEQGESEAQDFLGTLHFKGWGVPQDYTEARQWWEKAAVDGSASAQSDLAMLYANGLGGIPGPSPSPHVVQPGGRKRIPNRDRIPQSSGQTDDPCPDRRGAAAGAGVEAVKDMSGHDFPRVA